MTHASRFCSPTRGDTRWTAMLMGKGGAPASESHTGCSTPGNIINNAGFESGDGHRDWAITGWTVLAAAGAHDHLYCMAALEQRLQCLA